MELDVAAPPIGPDELAETRLCRVDGRHHFVPWLPAVRAAREAATCSVGAPAGLGILRETEEKPVSHSLRSCRRRCGGAPGSRPAQPDKGELAQRSTAPASTTWA